MLRSIHSSDDNQSSFFCYWNEPSWGNELALRVLPANQRLKTGNIAALMGNNRLVVNAKFVT